MGFYLLIAGTVILFFLAGPPLLMAYAALKERREKQLAQTGGPGSDQL
jgi:hypothetical protein